MKNSTIQSEILTIKMVLTKGYSHIEGRYSLDGDIWILLHSDLPPNIAMGSTLYLGLAATSGHPDEIVTAVFEDVTINGKPFTGYDNQDIGIRSNTPDPLYVELRSGPATARIFHPQSDAVQSDSWRRWDILLSEFAKRGVDLGNIEEITLGVGDLRGDPGGHGIIYVDDIRLYPSRPELPPDHPDYDQWLAVGSPACWTFPRHCHGDADGRIQGNAKTGYMHVFTRDLNILIAAWDIAEPPHGPGLASATSSTGDLCICADFARDLEGDPQSGFYRVHFNDLSRLVTHWMIREPPKGPGIPPDCGGTFEPEP